MKTMLYSRMKTILYWAARIIAVVLMVQTLYYKFQGAEESVYIFTTVGMEPWGRILVGSLELIASVLILINSTVWLGAGLALGLMMGAVFMHLTILGIVVKGDGGQLFLYAVIVSVCSSIILLVNKEKVTGFIRAVFSRAS